MQIFRCISDVPNHLTQATITLGVFDGLHCGHMEIIRKTIEISITSGSPSMLVSFEPHPRNVLPHFDGILPRLTTLEEKTDILAQTGLEAALFLRTDMNLLSLDAGNFATKYLVEQLRIRNVIVGFDYHFGKGRDGNPDKLIEIGYRYGFGVSVVPSINLVGHSVRSSVIRTHLAEGSLGLANALLGRNYTLRGTVVAGAARGRQLGFPTANVEPEHPEKLVPGKGVYLTRVRVADNVRFGICNIGNRPTFNEPDSTIEIYIIDMPDADLYQQKIHVEFLEWLRPEIKYPDVTALIAQMEADKKLVLEKITQNTY